jgi:hypothetical protein
MSCKPSNYLRWNIKAICYPIFALLAGIAPAFATTVTMPNNGAQVSSPFKLVASTETCDSVPAVSMGYSIDQGPTTITKTSFSALVVAGNGQHVLHVKCWGRHGAAGDTNVDITVVPPATSEPTNITVVSNIQSSTNWVWDHDPGTSGNAEGTSDIVAAPATSGNARQFSMSYTGGGGEIFHTSFGKDPTATHFIYEAQLWLDDPSFVANLEMDMNQVIANGDTVIYGVQCDGYSGTWDYTLNVGTPQKPKDKWIHSNVACPAPRTWEAKTWHSVQISYSRDNAGNVTYDSVVLDGEQANFVGATGNSAFSLGWGSTLLTNFQIDGLGADGSANVFLDKVNISRW